MTEKSLERTLIADKSANRTVLHRFLDESAKVADNNDKLLSSEELYHGMGIFLELHELINDPKTREKNALLKAELIRKLVLHELNSPDETELETRGIHLEIITAIDPRTGSLTHNTVVTFGNPTSGPNTVLEVHHDTIDAKDYSLSYEETVNKKELVGRTIQDNTVHLAATLSSLRYVETPKKGAITYVFSDFEENGCRGSTAIADVLLSRMSKEFPVTFIALESTNGKLALGHKGKFSGEIKVTENETTLLETYLAFYQSLNSTQHYLYEASGNESLLGKTVGTSTFGHASKTDFSALIDIRTNEVATPDMVETKFNDSFNRQGLKSSRELIEEAQRLLATGLYDLNFVNNELVIRSASTIKHPSAFNPHADETVLPILYLVLQTLKKMGYGNNVQEVTWGEESKKNSNPLQAVIQGDFESIDMAELHNNLLELNIATNPEPKPLRTLFSFDSKKTAKTGAVVTQSDEIVTQITTDIANTVEHEVEQTTMNFMTDIGYIFNAAQNRGISTRGFVYGVGNPQNLHGVERLSIEQVIEIFASMKHLVNDMHKRTSALSA